MRFWVVAYIARAVIELDATVFLIFSLLFCHLGKKAGAGHYTKIPSEISKQHFRRVWGAVLRNACASSTNLSVRSTKSPGKGEIWRKNFEGSKTIPGCLLD